MVYLNFIYSLTYFLDNYPNILWIWETAKLSLHSLVLQLDPIKSAKWHPKFNKLVICTGNNRLYMWTDKGCCVIDLPIRIKTKF